MIKGLMRSSLCFLLNLFFASLCAQSPSVPLLIDSATATQHLVSSQQPSMPPIARAAHVYGDVKLQLTIDTSGRVSAITVLQGPEMLRGAALDAIQQWTYRPFTRNGQPVNATTVVTLVFSQSTPTESSAGRKVPQGFIEARMQFVEAEVECHEKLRANAKLEKLLKSCSQAAAKADAMQDFNGWEESRMEVYLTAASVLLRDHQYEIVRTYANKTLDLVASGHGGMTKPCAAYTTRAEAEWGLERISVGYIG